MGLLDFLKKNKPHEPADKQVSALLATRLPSEDAAATTPRAAAPADASAVPSKTVARAEPPLDLNPPRQDPPATVRAFDEFGRQVEIPLAAWRDMMLLAADKAQDDPERLHGIVVEALQLRLAADVLPVARRLQEIDPDRERSSTVLGIVLMDTGDAAGAAQLFTEFETAQRQCGEKPSGVVLTNHAKALVAMGDTEGGEAKLWHALEADPNQENGLGWFAAIARERGGQEEYLVALERVAALSGAWRPQVSLARAALERNDLDAAKRLYAEALERAGTPAPVVLLQSMSGDLGNRGHLQEALSWTRPAYDAQVHGLPVGNNLIKASLDTGQLEDAQTLVEELQRQNRPEWMETLQYWETEVRRAVLARQAPLPETPPEVTALAIEGPVWLPSGSPARALFAEARGPKVLFLAASVGYAEQPAALQGTLPDAQGRLSRALPLFLAESAFLHMGLDANTIVPWVAGHGFAVMGSEWSDADAADYARSAGAVAAVVLHLQQTGEATEAHLRVVRAQPSDGAEVSAMSGPVGWAQTGSVALQLWSQMAHALLQVAAPSADASEGAGVDAARYQIPSGTALGNYLLRLEQLLAVRCAGSEKPGKPFLSGEREIVRGQLDLALSMPASLPLRLILHETLLRMRDLRPEIVAEIRWPVELLQERYPLADAEASAVLERQLTTVYGPGSSPQPNALVERYSDRSRADEV